MSNKKNYIYYKTFNDMVKDMKQDEVENNFRYIIRDYNGLNKRHTSMKQKSRYKDFKTFLYSEPEGSFPVSRSKLFKLALKRYKMGEKKFKDKTFLKSKRELVKDIYEELADALVYLFMYYVNR